MEDTAITVRLRSAKPEAPLPDLTDCACLACYPFGKRRFSLSLTPMPTPDGLYLITFSKKHLPRRFLWNGRRLALYREGEIIAYAILEKLPDTRLDRNQLPNRDALLSTPRLMNRALSLSLPLKKKRPSLPLDTQLLRTLPRLSGSDIDLLCRTVRTVRDDILWNLLRPDTGKPTHTIDQNYYSVIHGKYPWINSKNLEYFLRCEEHYHWHGSDY